MALKLKKAQAWGFDLMMASIIFMGGIIAFYLYAINTPTETEEIIKTLSYHGDIIASSLLSEGLPTDWDEQNVINPGILSDNKINQAKLELFYNLSTNNYEKTQSLFDTDYDYYIFLSENFTIEGNQVEGIGNQPQNPKHLIKISRVTIYNNKPISLNIEIWE